MESSGVCASTARSCRYESAHRRAALVVRVSIVRERSDGSADAWDKVNLSQKFSLFTSHWEPKIVGQVNGHHVKLAKFQGPFVWHRHENEDKLFLVHGGPRCLVRARVHGEHRRRAEQANRHGV